VKPTAEGSGLLVNASKFEPLLVEVPERQSQSGQKPDREGGLADRLKKKQDSKSA